jgi:diguanylate cyclase (GGDEF)-like protein/PAS domain S-box-containing protein
MFNLTVARLNLRVNSGMVVPKEKLRLQAIHRLAVLDSAPEESFDRIVATVIRLFNVPIALVSLVDEHRQWFKACIGMDVRETDRSLSFCAHAIESDGVLVVNNALQDPRFKDNALVTGDPSIRFYAGAPLVTSDGAKLGTLCVIDTVARSNFSPADQATLEDLAATVVDALELRIAGIRLREMQAEAEAERRLLSEVFASLDEGVIVRDANGQILAANQSAGRLLGMPLDQLFDSSNVGHPSQAIRPDGSFLQPEDHPTAIALREARPVTDVLIGLQSPDGSQTWLSVNARPIIEPGQSRPNAVVASFTDITDRRATQQRLEYQAGHDQLTGLPNRAFFLAKLQLALTQLEQTKSESAAFAVGFLDLDRFKAVNDLYGHACGDLILKQVTVRLSSILRDTDMIARVGGDEFTLFLPGLRTDEAANQMMLRIAQVLEAPFMIDRQEISIGASVGLALCPNDAQTSEALLAAADRQMYSVKQKTKLQIAF